MTKQSYLQENHIDYLDYKDVATIERFLTPHARIQARKKSGTTAAHQRTLAQAVKRARFMGLLPYVVE
jgi:small subunit ribosomal protein S18